MCLLFLFLAGIRISRAQGLSQDLSFLHLQSWSTEEGLPQSSVHRILQTRDGYLWVATEGGVARFDGVSFKAFTHAQTAAFVSDDVCCMVEDRTGSLWFGTADGLVRLQGNEFRRFGEADGLSSASIVSLVAMDDGTLLMLTANGLAMWDAERMHPALREPPMPEKITAIERERDGGAWIVAGAGLFHLRAAVVTAAPCGTAKTLSPMTGVAEGLDGSMWLRSASSVTLCAGEREWTVGKTLPGSRVESLFVDRSGRAWIGTNDGVARLTANSRVAERVPALEGNAVLETFEDREGNFWIGTETSGLQVLRALKFRSEAALANQALSAVAQTTDGAIWVGTRQDGVRRVREGAVDEPVASGKLTSPLVTSIAPGERGSVWVGTPDGLNHVEANGAVRRLTQAEGLPDDFIRSLAAGADGSVWVGTRHGLAHVEGSRISTLTKANGLGSDLIGSLLLARRAGAQELWIGTSGGLSRLQPDGKMTTLTSKDGLPNDVVAAMAEDQRGTLWVASRDGGLSRYGNGRFAPVKGLAGVGEIAGMIADGSGYLWLRRARAVERVSLAELNACADGGELCSLNVAQYGVADGLPSQELAAGGSPVVWRTAAGELWFATRRGVAIANADHLPNNAIAPLVVVQRFTIDEQAIDVDQQPLRIPFGHARFTFEYAGLSYTVPSKVRYRFILSGFDRAWTEAGARRSATYTNLPPGAYVLRVQSANDDGVWSDPGAELRFRIVPPFYRRWWFAALVLLCAGGLFVALYRLRLRRLRRQFEAVLGERNRMAREIHDTLAQDFVGISLQLDIVSHLLGATKTAAALEQVQRTRKLVTEGLAEARRSIWELRANTAQDSLPTRLAKVVDRFKTEEITMRLQIGGAFRPLGDEVESEVLRVAQEALSNVQRHAGASEASVDLQYGGDMLILTVADNGQGFSVESASRAEGHFGLQGMRERAAVLGGRLEVASESGRGAKVILSTPIRAAGER